MSARVLWHIDVTGCVSGSVDDESFDGFVLDVPPELALGNGDGAQVWLTAEDGEGYCVDCRVVNVEGAVGYYGSNLEIYLEPTNPGAHVLDEREFTALVGDLKRAGWRPSDEVYRELKLAAKGVAA